MGFAFVSDDGKVTLISGSSTWDMFCEQLIQALDLPCEYVKKCNAFQKLKDEFSSSQLQFITLLGLDVEAKERELEIMAQKERAAWKEGKQDGKDGLYIPIFVMSNFGLHGNMTMHQCSLSLERLNRLLCSGKVESMPLWFQTALETFTTGLAYCVANRMGAKIV